MLLHETASCGNDGRVVGQASIPCMASSWSLRGRYPTIRKDRMQKSCWAILLRAWLSQSFTLSLCLGVEAKMVLDTLGAPPPVHLCAQNTSHFLCDWRQQSIRGLQLRRWCVFQEEQWSVRGSGAVCLKANPSQGFSFMSSAAFLLAVFSWLWFMDSQVRLRKLVRGEARTRSVGMLWRCLTGSSKDSCLHQVEEMILYWGGSDWGSMAAIHARRGIRFLEMLLCKQSLGGCAHESVAVCSGAISLPRRNWHNTCAMPGSFLPANGPRRS